jgi:carbonyl reductase 1
LAIDDKVVEDTLKINYYGTLHATEAFLPLLKKQGAASRVVNVASMSGHLSKYSPAIKQRFLDARAVEDATALMEDFRSAVSRKHEKQEGWQSAAYATSKAGVIAFTKAIAAREEKAGNGALVNACCPGWVDTDMTKGKGTKTPDQGAQTPVLLAIGDVGGKTGEFWQEDKVIEW